MRSASELEASCTETLSRSCVPSCMKETGAPCTELSNMCEVDAVAPSHRPFMRLAASKIEQLLFWASESKKKRQNYFGFFAQAFNAM